MRKLCLVVLLFVPFPLISIDNGNSIDKELLPSQQIMTYQIEKLDALTSKLDALEEK